MQQQQQQQQRRRREKPEADAGPPAQGSLELRNSYKETVARMRKGAAATSAEPGLAHLTRQFQARQTVYREQLAAVHQENKELKRQLQEAKEVTAAVEASLQSGVDTLDADLQELGLLEPEPTSEVSAAEPVPVAQDDSAPVAVRQEATEGTKPKPKPKPKRWMKKSTLAVLAAARSGAMDEDASEVKDLPRMVSENLKEVAKLKDGKTLWTKASTRVKVTTWKAPTPWRDENLSDAEKARVFLATIEDARDKMRVGNLLLDHHVARTLVERMWNYDLDRLHDQALKMGADPLRIITVAAEGNYGLETFDTRESILALIVLRQVKKPPSMAETTLRENIEGIGCHKEGCIQPITGRPCTGGCKWDYTEAAGPTSGCTIRDQNRHKGLVALRKLALDWQISPAVIFKCCAIPNVKDQKEALSSALFKWAKNFDYVRPKPPSTEDENGRDQFGQLRPEVPATEEALEGLTTKQSALMAEGQMRTIGRAWEKNPPCRCCNYRRCHKNRAWSNFIKSPSLQVLGSYSGTVLEWCLTGSQMWIAVGVYIITRSLLRVYRAPEYADWFPPIQQPSVIGGFLSFFLVFYASQAFQRFCEQYDCSTSAVGRIFDIVCLAHAEMPKAAATRLWRHANLAHAMAYTSLSEIYTVDNFLKPINQRYGMCSRAEWKRVEELKPGAGGSIPTREVITWAIHDIIQQTIQTEKPLRAYEHMSLTALIKRAKQSKVDEALWNEESTLYRMNQIILHGAEHLRPSKVERAIEVKKIISHITKDPDTHTPIAEWNTDKVKEWMFDLDRVELDDSVAKAIYDNQLIGTDLLHLNDEHLKSIGITSISYRFRILEAALKMNGLEEKMSDMRADELINQVMRLRGTLGGLADYKLQPMPFFYVHLLFLIAAIYLPMFAYSLALETSLPSSCDYTELGKNTVCDGDATSIGVYEGAAGAKNLATCAQICNEEDGCMFFAYWPDHTCRTWASCLGHEDATPGWTHLDLTASDQTLHARDYYGMCWGSWSWELAGVIVIFLQNIVVIGLIRAGQQLSDPYGSDNVDLPVRDYVINTLKASKKILNTAVDKNHASEAREAEVSELRLLAKPSKTLRERIKKGITLSSTTTLVDRVRREINADSAKKGPSQPRADDVCYHCKGHGHWKSHCPFLNLPPDDAKHAYFSDLLGDSDDIVKR